MKLLNLDKIIPDDKRIRIAGRDWIIPGEVPVKVMLDIMKTSAELETSTEYDVIERAFKPLHDVFSIKNDIEFEEFIKIISMSHYGKIVQFIINSFGAEEIEEKKTLEGPGEIIMMKSAAAEG